MKASLLILAATACAHACDLQQGGLHRQGPELSLQNACGPLAVFVACAWVDVPCTLTDVVQACDWHAGEPTPMRSVLTAFERLRVPHSPVKTTAEDLRVFLGKPGVAALLLLANQDETARHLRGLT